MAASTGSPASRRSTKLTPLTTRPSLTSRQGITRTLNIFEKLLGRGARAADQRQCGCGIEAAVVKRAARDRTGEFPGARGKQRLDVVDGSKAARGDHRDRYPLGECNGRVEVQTLQKAVARYIGENDG